VSLERRIERLEGRIEPSGESEESKWRATRQEYAERLDEMAQIYRQEGQAIKERMVVLQGQGVPYKDAQIIAKDEVLRAKNPELWDWFNQSFPPELRHDPVAKFRWLSDYIESRRTRRSGRA
jgi:hypothetical protein